MELVGLGTKILLHLIPRSLPDAARRQHLQETQLRGSDTHVEGGSEH